MKRKTNVKSIIFLVLCLLFIPLTFSTDYIFTPIPIDTHTTQIGSNLYNYNSQQINVINSSDEWESCKTALKYERKNKAITFKIGKKETEIKYAYILDQNSSPINDAEDVMFFVEQQGCNFYYTQNITNDNVKVKSIKYKLSKEAKFKENKIHDKLIIIDFKQAKEKQNIKITYDDKEKEVIFEGANISRLDPTVTLNESSGDLYDDTQIDSNNPTLDYGTKTSLTIRNTRYILFKFNTTSIGTNFVISNAIFSIYMGSSTGQTYTSIYHIYAYPDFNITNVTGSYEWIEGDSDGGACTGNELCWSNRPNVSSQMNLTSYDSITASDPSGWNSFNVTNLFINSQDRNEKNVTFLINNTSPDGDYGNYYSKEGVSWGEPYIDITYSLDVIPEIPVMSFVSGTNQSQTNVTWNFTATDTEGLAQWLYANNMSGTWVNSSYTAITGTSNSSSFSFNLSNATRGKNVCFQVFVNDSAGQQNLSTVNCLTTANTAPITPINLSPINGQTYGLPTVTMNFTSTDIDGDTITYYLFINESSNPSTQHYSSTDTNYTADFSDNTYYWTVLASDGFDNSSNTTIRNIVVSTGVPAVSLITPDNTYFSTTSTTLEYQASDAGLTNCSIYLNSTGTWALNETNQSTPSGTTVNFTISMEEGVYLWNVLCYDNGGASGWGSSNKTFTVDTTYPLLNITAPTGVITTSSVTAEWNYTEINPDVCTYNVTVLGSPSNLEKSNTIVACTDLTDGFTLTTGFYIFNFCITDKASFSNCSSSNFNVSISSGDTTGGGGGGDDPPIIITINESEIQAKFGLCNSNNICERDLGETSRNCPNDCGVFGDIQNVELFNALIAIIVVASTILFMKSRKKRK